MRLLCILLVSILTMNTAKSAPAKPQPLVFVSSFAAGEKGAIHAYRLNLKSGALKQVASNDQVEHPFFLALSDDQRFLYSIDASSFGGEINQVAAFALKGRSGNLKLLNRQSTHGKASCYLDVDATGKSLLVANYLTGDVGSIPLKKNGSLGKMESLFRHKGSSVDPKRQKAPYAHCVVVSPDNRFAFAADLGIDKVMSYRLEPELGKITQNKPSFVKVPAGSGPRHLTFHPNGKFVYVINELANTISVFSYAAKAGKLTEIQNISTLPKDFGGRTHTADLKITPNGKFLYGTNRGHDSIGGYQISKDGKLKLIEIIPSLGKGPQNLAIAPDGRHLFCANMPGNSLVTFRVGEAGKLKKVGKTIEVTMPSCIMIAE
ncbi:MAG: 6-phosphogluconolactonase [Verrucomicrobiales bacterium]|nr:6-phosphogluconolactonase [Verrucomicrobiales bacterium]|tara:strand:- start:8795 stop:9922 length:1128 start_codon:yes stop_codon:yes gene_type:complete